MSHPNTVNDIDGRYTIIESGCWEWQWGLDSHGYGQMKLNGSSFRAHRASWIKHNGPIPEGLNVLHSCDNRRCINPDHLFLGTHQDNMDDRENKGRGACHKGDNNGRASLSSNDVFRIRARLTEGVSCAILAREYNVTWTTIQNIKVGRTWRHLP